MYKNEFTKGKIYVNDKWCIYGGLHPHQGSLICVVTPWDPTGCKEEDQQNVELITSAFKSAAYIAGAGYDAIAMLKALPQIVQHMERTSSSRELLDSFKLGIPL